MVIQKPGQVLRQYIVVGKPYNKKRSGSYCRFVVVFKDSRKVFGSFGGKEHISVFQQVLLSYLLRFQIGVQNSMQVPIFVKIPGLQIHQIAITGRLGEEPGLDLCNIFY